MLIRNDMETKIDWISLKEGSTPIYGHVATSLHWPEEPQIFLLETLEIVFSNTQAKNLVLISTKEAMQMRLPMLNCETPGGPLYYGVV